MGGEPYGDIIVPDSLGSGGGNSENYVGGSGGGLINMRILNSFYFTGYLFHSFCPFINFI